MPSSGETAEDIAVASAIISKGILLTGGLNIIYPNDQFYTPFVALSLTYGDAHNQLASRAQGKSVVHLYNSDIASISINTPSLAEQERIGGYFRELDAAIEGNERELGKLERMKTAFLQKMFPRPGHNTPQLRFANFTQPWKAVRLGDNVNRVVRKNSTNECSLPLTISAEFGLIDQNEFFNHRVASTDVSGYYLIKTGEFAYNKSSCDGYPYGAVKRLDRYKQGVLSTLYIVFELTPESEINSDWLVHFFDTSLWHKHLALNASEGARNHGLLNISADAFFMLPLLIPSLSEQQAIAGFFRELDGLIGAKKRYVEKLRNVKSALLRKMFVNTAH